MEPEEERLFIRELAYQWALLDLPNEVVTYQDYSTAVTLLHTATGNAAQTEYIFTVVLHQARRLGKSSGWVEQELQFEGMIEFTSRKELLNLYRKRQAVVDDATLDLFNERLNRFN